ncbi:MAG: DUF6788 family protein [candidate division NC10 bacterium]
MFKDTVPSEVSALAAQLAEAKPMRRGSVSERYVKCNRAGCACAERADRRHGPYVSVSRVVKGKTQSRWLGAGEAKVVRAQVEAGQEFRRQVEAYWQACEKWADAQLCAPEATSQEAAKKRGSKRPSKPRSSPRSKRS